MLHRFHDRFGTAGVVIGVIALIVALGGTAFAAAGLNSKQKKEVTKIAKKYAGKPGAPGAAGTNGTNGTAGAKGDTGAAGAAGGQGIQGIQGIPGTTGKTVLSGTATPTGATGTDGDFYIETDVNKIYGPKAAGAWPAGVDLKGPEGSPWTAGGTLPSTKTETGVWSIGDGDAVIPPGGFAQIAYDAVSFPIPLAAPLDSSHVRQVLANGKELVPPETEQTPVNCTGSAAAPAAPAGFLCVYTGVAEHEFFFIEAIKKASAAGEGADKSGAVLVGAGFNKEMRATGTWAVTAP